VPLPARKNNVVPPVRGQRTPRFSNDQLKRIKLAKLVDLEAKFFEKRAKWFGDYLEKPGSECFQLIEFLLSLTEKMIRYSCMQGS
jgi:hypothetical protein